MPSLIFLLAAAAAGPAAAAGDTIVVTAEREPAKRDEAPVSATVFDADRLRDLSLPMTADLLRLAPGVAVASTGPRGTQTQVRIRGAEANHTLLFVDGIRFNDPAAGNEARFELLASDVLSRVEVVRGPQSALWGSEALGGVIAVDSADPARDRGLSLLGEYGSLDSGRAAGQFALQAGPLGLSGAAGWLSSAGIDSFGRGGERDGFETRSASLRAAVNPLSSVRVGLTGHYVASRSDYDGFDPATFRRADTLDSTRNRLAAVRAFARAETGGWTLSADSSWLGSRNRNSLAGAPLNRTAGERFTAGAQASRNVGGHRLTFAYEHEAERFRARDTALGGATRQDRARRLDAFVGEWRAEWSRFLSTDLALRHDDFSAFADSTTLRAAVTVTPALGWRVHAAYGEGIAQPTFYDLYGFFPGSFRGNPDLAPERSRGWEAGLRWTGKGLSLGATAFSNRLEDEIVDVTDRATFQSSTANASGKSRRRGVELEGEYHPSTAFRIGFNYTWLRAGERQVAGSALVREIRRPSHTANLIAGGSSGRLSWGGSLAWVGARRDFDFDPFPAKIVRLGDYLLASVRLGRQVTRTLEAFVRAENLLDARYQDVVGYNTPGRTVYAGLRLRLGD
jgi:vitamin B12 transporter